MEEQSEDYNLAKKEIDESFYLSLFSMKQFGLSFDPAPDRYTFYKRKILFYISYFSISYHIFSDIVNISLTIKRTPKVENVVPLFHTFGYGALSSAKLFAIWYKKDVFGQCLKELVNIWPKPPLDEVATEIKIKSLAALRFAHRCFFVLNMSGVWFYILTPLIVFTYQKVQGVENAKLGNVWACWYPFDKTDPMNHFFVYIFESFSGQTCVWAMVASDFLFTGIASHICMLLRMLHRQLRSIGTENVSREIHYANILECIKLHQRLITYCNDLEEAFSVVNLINVTLSSIQICCVVFVIVLLDPIIVINNKLFLGSALIQIGIICWYSDDIFHSNADVAVAAYDSAWYETDPKCRRALLFLIKRAQKPIAFTAMNITNMSLVTYSLILYRSYSYFALLYTMYRDN